MLRSILTLTALALAATASVAADKEERLFEMRVYTAAAGKLDAVNARFRDHTVKLFEKHGMTNVGYFVPADGKEEKLYYFLSFKDKAARDKAFKEFGADPDWKKAQTESEKNGRIVTKVESTFLTATDYSPVPKIEKSKEDRVFELRTYTARKGNLPALNARFKDHTMKLFEKHGMTNVAYWNYTKGLKQKSEDEMLVYMLAHKSPEAMKASWDKFRADPTWVEARKQSEEKAGGSLTVQDGVKSVVLKATDYSPMK